jgi:hypothetical protein
MAVNVTPRMQLIDMKTGQLTRDGYLLLSSLNDAISDATSDFVRLDAVQTLTNKTIDGDANTFNDIPTAALATRTGDGTRVVTADAAGTSGRLAEWDADGNLTSGADIDDYTTTAALTALLAAKQDAGAIVILPTYTVAGVPAAASNTRGLIYVSNETGGATVAFSDGTNWRRVQDRAIIS